MLFSCWHLGYYSDSLNKVFITAQLFYIQTDSPAIRCLLWGDVDGDFSIETDKFDESIMWELSQDLLLRWNKNYSAEIFLLAPKYKCEPADPS